jgi:hypothetical protein
MASISSRIILQRSMPDGPAFNLHPSRVHGRRVGLADQSSEGVTWHREGDGSRKTSNLSSEGVDTAGVVHNGGKGNNGGRAQE